MKMDVFNVHTYDCLNRIAYPQAQQTENMTGFDENSGNEESVQLATLHNVIFDPQDSGFDENSGQLATLHNAIFDPQDSGIEILFHVESVRGDAPQVSNAEDNSTELEQENMEENTSQGQETSSAVKYGNIRSRGRKRQGDPPNWKKNQAKKARQLGQEYVNKTGNIVKARQIKEGCTEKCRLQCKSKLTEQQRQGFFDEFWSTDSHEKKWEFITRRVLSQAVATHTTNWESSRKESRSYSFRVAGKNLKVCKTMFLNTLDINDAWVRTALQKQGNNNALQPDLRGKHTKHRLTPALLSSMKEHISAFPKVPSHYCRKDSNREYLDENLNIKKMYEMYKIWMAENYPSQLPIASERQYRDTFNNDFNLHFFKPKKDQCDVCFAWVNATPEEKTKKQEDYDKHIKAKNLARSMKDGDKKAAQTNKSACVACFDLQKVLPCPRAESSAFYYKRHLAIYNFTVYDCTRNEGFCYLWNETIGKKGSNEIASFLFHFIGKKVGEGITNFVFYSDNCAGQNRNRFVFSMFHLASVKYNVEITHRFLEVGHTQNEGDSMHALIERKSKGVTIFSPEDWITIVKTAKTGKKPYQVFEIEQEHIFDFKDLASKQNWEKDTKGDKVFLSRIREIKTKGDLENNVIFRYAFDAECKELCIANKRKGRPLSLLNYNLNQAYNSALPIDTLKLNDLLTLCNSGAIPSTRHVFYQSIFAANKKNTTNDFDKDE